VKWGRTLERVVFNEELCKACGLCIAVCPKKIIVLADYINSNGYQPATIINQESCKSCAACGRVCPDGVISVYRPI